MIAATANARVPSSSAKGNVIFARELLIGGIAARTPDGAAASNRKRGLARIDEARPAIGRGVSVCSDDPFRQTATCRGSPLSETPGDSRLCAQPTATREKKRKKQVRARFRSRDRS